MSAESKRLREHDISPHHGGCADCYGTAMDDGADRIDALEIECDKLRGSLRLLLAFMEFDIAVGKITAYETRQEAIREARALVLKVQP